MSLLLFRLGRIATKYVPGGQRKHATWHNFQQSHYPNTRPCGFGSSATQLRSLQNTNRTELRFCAELPDGALRVEIA